MFAILFCFYAPAYMLVPHNVNMLMPGSDGVSVFGQANGGGFIILSLLCLDPKPARWWPVMAVAAACFPGRPSPRRVARHGGGHHDLGCAVEEDDARGMDRCRHLCRAGIGFLLDVNLPSPGERGGAISSTEIVARGVAAVSPDMARDLTGSDNVSFYSGTIKWRKMWWEAIWQNSQENYTNLLIGPGYGFPLKNLVNYLKDKDLRTPHNVFYYALGYSGWIGVVIFFSLQIACGVLLWRTYKVTGQAWGLAVWASGLTAAFFGNVMETPAGAIPFYLTMGLFVGPALSAIGSPARQALSRRAPSSVAYPAGYAAEGVYTSEAI